MQVPLNYAYWISNSQSTSIQAIGDQLSNADAMKRPYDNKVTRAIAFDIRTSLFSDPVTYKLAVEAHYQDLQTFKAAKVNKKSVRNQYSPTTVVNQVKKHR